MKKRILAFVLVVAMSLSMFATCVFADTLDGVEPLEQTEIMDESQDSTAVGNLTDTVFETLNGQTPETQSRTVSCDLSETTTGDGDAKLTENQDEAAIPETCINMEDSYSLQGDSSELKESEYATETTAFNMEETASESDGIENENEKTAGLEDAEFTSDENEVTSEAAESDEDISSENESESENSETKDTDNKLEEIELVIQTDESEISTLSVETTTKSDSKKADNKNAGETEISTNIGDCTVTATLSEGEFPEDAWINVEKLTQTENNVAEQNSYETLSEHIDQLEEMPVPDENIYTAIDDPVITSFQSDSYQIEVCYYDEDNEIQKLTTEQQDNLSLEFAVSDEADEDDGTFSEVEIFSLSDDLQTSEYLEDNTATETDSDIYTIAVCTFSTEDYSAKYSAEQRACGLMNSYADPSCFLSKDVLYYKTSDAHFQELKQVAANVISGASTDYEKIQKMTQYVSETIYYDYVYYETLYCPSISRSVTRTSTPLDPYDVYKYKYTVCAGYAGLLQTLLISQNIPCMYLRGEDHAFNAAYDSGSGKWIIIDATWASGNTYGKNGTTISYKGTYNSNYFNISLDRLASINNHEIYSINSLLSDGGYYTLHTVESNWTNIGSWYLALSGNKNSVVNMVAGLDSVPVTVIDSYAFNGNTTLQKITITDLISKISYAAFYNCKNLKTVNLPDSIESIGDFAFSDCPNLSGTITIPSKVTYLGASCFSGCGKITAVNFKCKGLKSIEKNAFYECTGLSGKLTVPSGVTSIGNYAFKGCKKLTSVSFPKSLTTIGEYAFYGCTSLSGKLTIPSKVTSLGTGCFYDCYKLTYVKFSSGIKEIKAYTFYNCSGLKGSLYLPYSLVSIGYAAFYTTDFTRVFIYKKVQSIGAFNFPYVKKVYYYGTKTAWKKINIGSQNSGLCNGKITYNYRKSQTICASPVGIYYSYASVKAAAQTFKINVTGAVTTLYYKSSSKYITVDSKGNVTVKKKTPKGTYKITVGAKRTSIYAGDSETIKIVVK